MMLARNILSINSNIVYNSEVIMRIIAGKVGGFRLKTLTGLSTRPTADRVKESVFGILTNKLDNALVLDLFAGSGGLGLEALSRGAAHAVFVDSKTSGIVKSNAVQTGFVNSVEVYGADVYTIINRLARDKRRFDLIFCDPPYNLGLAPKVLRELDAIDVLRAGGVFILEHSRHEKLPEELKRIVAYRSEFYGETVVSFFIKQEGSNSENCSVPG